MARPVLTVALVLGLAHNPIASGVPPAMSLGDEIAAQDKTLFDAFNAHDLEGVMASFAESLEFYHDRDGLLTKAQVAEGFRALFAQDNGLRRELVPGSLQVHPVPGYGAIQVGEHRFCHDEKGQEDCGVFQFIHVWRKNDAGWKLTRVLSYGH